MSDQSAVLTTVVVHCGATVAKAVPSARWQDLVDDGVGLSPVSDAFDLGGGIDPLQSLARPDGDLRLRPDATMLRTIGGAPGWAWAPADRYYQDGSPYPGDQRLFARRMQDRLAESGMSARAGFEIEWSVGRDVEDFAPAWAGGPYSARRVVAGHAYARDVIEALRESGIPVEQFHAEYAPGQFEVALPTRDPLTAADEVVLARLVIAAVSDAHGLRASFSPMMTPELTGNGGHLHFSLAREGVPLFGGGDGPAGITDAGAAVIVGLLQHADALLAISAPAAVSYLRLRPNSWAGVYRVWGVENREAPIRLVPGTHPEAASVEVKNADLMANPYLFVGSVLAIAEAALAGGTEGELPPAVVGDPGQSGCERLPADLAAAVAAFRVDEVLAAALGEDLHRTIGESRDAEIRRTDGMTPDEVVASTRWWT